MSDWIEFDGKKYFEESYLQLAQRNTQRLREERDRLRETLAIFANESNWDRDGDGNQFWWIFKREWPQEIAMRTLYGTSEPESEAPADAGPSGEETQQAFEWLDSKPPGASVNQMLEEAEQRGMHTGFRECDAALRGILHGYLMKATPMDDMAVLRATEIANARFILRARCPEAFEPQQEGR